MSGIEGKKGYYLQKTGARVNELLERHYIVPTFTTSPTEDTLSWDDDGHIVYFRIGEIIRVKTSEGYDFYRVNDIKDNKINWVKIDTPSDTYTKDEIDVKFFTKEDASGYISEKLVNYYSKREVDGKIEQTNKSVLEQTERVDNLGVELKNKASAEQVNKLESGLETTKRSIAEQTTKVTALQSEIKTKASTQSVTQLGDSVNIISDTVAEQTIRTDELEASIETKVSQEVFDATTGDINSEFIAVKQTTDAIETAVKAQSGEITAISESVNGLSISLGTIESDLDSLRNQMDGTTESYFEKWIPTNENEPAKTWIEQGKEVEHKGDTFTNTSLDGEGAGKSWRWLQDDNGNWGWQPIADTDALKALEAAAKAQAAADGKVTIYYEQPSNYKKGDIWFVHNNSYSSYKQGEILSAKTENTVFSISDWESKTRYTQAVEDLNDVMITTFKDGVLTEAERISIIESITNIANEQAAVQARYNIIIINANLTDETLKNEFKATKVAYDTVCTSLINIVEQIADAKAENLESLFDSYTQLSDDYSEAYATHNEKESEINNALMGRLNPANVYIDNITDDGILTPIEKEQLFEIYRNIAREYDATRSNALNYKIWKYGTDGITEESGLNGGEGRYNNYIAFKSAYNNVASVFSSSIWGFTQMKESTTLPEGYTTTLLKSYLDTYYEKYGILTESFSAITAAIENAQKAAEETLQGLTDNLRPEEMSTIVGKGVVLSTIIATKDVNGNITAGMNASSAHYNPEHGRVVFVGGAKDISDFNNAPYVVYEDGHVKMESADIAAYASRVEMYTSLASKADISSFNEIVDAVNILKNMWRFEDVGGTLVLKSEYDVLTNGQFAAAAVGAEGSGSVGAAYLSDLYDVSLGSLLSGDILSWNGSEWVNIKQSSLVPDLSAYASKSFVSDALEGYLPKSGGTIEGSLAVTGYISNRGHYIYARENDNADWLVTDWNWQHEYTLYHTGNFNPSDYLPLTGGTINGNLILNSPNSDYALHFQTGLGAGWIGFQANSERWFVTNRNWSADYTLLHSGNVGYFAVVKGSYPTSGGNYNYAFESGLYSTNAVEEDLPISEAGNFVVNASYDSKASAQLYMRTSSDALYYRRKRSNVWYDWKTIAFTDSNVASATKLATPRTIWGQSFDGTGNVSGILTGVATIHFGNQPYGTQGIYPGGWYAEGYSDKDVAFYFDRALFSGNVLLGTTTDSGYKLNVNGTVHFGGTLTTSEDTIIDSTKYSGGYWARGIVWKQNDTELGNLCYTSVSDRRISIVHGAYNSALGVHILSNGNTLIGAINDRGHRLTVGRPDGAANLTSTTLNNSLLFVGMSESVDSYGTNFWTEGSGNGFIQQGRTDDEQPSLYDLILQPFGRNVGIGTPNPQYTLDVNGILRATAANFGGDWGINIGMTYADNTSGAYDLIERKLSGYPLYFQYNHNGHLFMCQGGGNVLIGTTTDSGYKLDVNGSARVNEITIGGIKLDVVNGALRVNGDIFSTGQFAASVAGEATGGNIVLDYASIVNALGYTPANNNNLAQVAFTGSYADLSNKPTSLPASDVYSWAKASVKPTYSWSEIQSRPDVYTKADVYNKNEINQKLAGVGGGGGSVGSTFGMDYINGQSFDMPNGVNCITSYSEATVNFSSIVPADPSLPCIVYIVKCDYHTLQVTSGCNIVSVNSSGDEVIDFSINGMTGMMLVWEPDYWRWFAYLQN